MKYARQIFCFPTASALASTWDVALSRAVGETLAAEALALSVGVRQGPGVNMKRTPLCRPNGSGSSHVNPIQVDMMGFMLQMPLLSILHCQESAWPVMADDLVDDLLRQVHAGAPQFAAI